MSRHHREPGNLEILDRFWRRQSFHDEVIEEVSAVNKRVLIRLDSWTLVITGATGLERCDLPAVWLDESIVMKANGFLLDVETDGGHLRVTGTDVRLIRNRDLAVLIPPIDA